MATPLKQEYRDIIRGYLQEISFKEVPSVYDSSLESHVVNYFQSRGISADSIRRVMPMIDAAVWIAATTYPFVPREVVELIAIYTALAIIIEDISEDILSDLRDFQVRILRKESQSNQWLATLVDVMDALRNHYCPFIGDMIVKATLEFLSASRFEEEHKESNPTMVGADFAYYMRLKSGIGEAYACFAFPQVFFSENDFLRTYLPAIPDLVRFFNLCNDLLSFYKESIVSTETLNYIHNHARSNNVPVIESLNETRRALVNSIRSMREILAVDVQALDNINQLLNGYIVFHINASRYKLSELDLFPLGESRVIVHRADYHQDITLTSRSKTDHLLSQVSKVANRIWRTLSGKGALAS